MFNICSLRTEGKIKFEECLLPLRFQASVAVYPNIKTSTLIMLSYNLAVKLISHPKRKALSSGRQRKTNVNAIL